MIQAALWLLIGSNVPSQAVSAELAVPAENELRQAVALYASFDEEVKADFGGGELTFATRVTLDAKKALFKVEKGVDNKIFRIAKGGISGGALNPVGVLPNNGRIFLPAKGNLAYKKGQGWGGAVSLWMDTDPNQLLKTPFCDPVQITEKGANNGGIWFDFNNAKPRRDLRLGVFPAVAPGKTGNTGNTGKKGASESDPDAPLVKVPGIPMQTGQWRHVCITWNHFDTDKPNAYAELFIDGKSRGALRDRTITMDWDIEKAGIYVAINYIGLLDEFAVFNRTLTAKEVALLKDKPDVLQELKRKIRP